MRNNGVIILVVSLIGAITTTQLNSPCPDLFHYDSTDKPGEWSGTITLLSDTELYGMWLRLIFDKQISNVTVEDNIAEVVQWDNNKEVLIKNKDILLRALTPKDIKITVKYGDEIPELVGYRLNARAICSRSNSVQFNGDTSSSEFISNLLLHKNKRFTEYPNCGTVPKESKQWPWQISINNKLNDKENYLCQGSLITSKHIVTAAHCVNYQSIELGLPPRHLIVRQMATNQQFAVEKVHIYPGYNSNSLLNDLAIVTLKDPINIDDNINPICLTNNWNIDHEGVIVQGASQVKVNWVDEDECGDLDGLITDNSICASYISGTAHCLGDSGSGLVTQRKEQSVWELRGIVTFSAALQNKCDPSTKILLIDISKYLKWIQSVIA